jgi:MFS family permease
MPTIISQLGGGNLYSWVGTQVEPDSISFALSLTFLRRSYMLGAAALVPLQGKLSDIIGRKPILFASVFLFIVSRSLM